MSLSTRQGCSCERCPNNSAFLKLQPSRPDSLPPLLPLLPSVPAQDKLRTLNRKVIPLNLRPIAASARLLAPQRSVPALSEPLRSRALLLHSARFSSTYQVERELTRLIVVSRHSAIFLVPPADEFEYRNEGQQISSITCLGTLTRFTKLRSRRNGANSTQHFRYPTKKLATERSTRSSSLRSSESSPPVFR